MLNDPSPPSCFPSPVVSFRLSFINTCAFPTVRGRFDSSSFSRGMWVRPPQEIQTQHSERQDLQSLEGRLVGIPVWLERGGKVWTAGGDDMTVALNLFTLVPCLSWRLNIRTPVLSRHLSYSSLNWLLYFSRLSQRLFVELIKIKLNV